MLGPQKDADPDIPILKRCWCDLLVLEGNALQIVSPGDGFSGYAPFAKYYRPRPLPP